MEKDKKYNFKIYELEGGIIEIDIFGLTDEENARKITEELLKISEKTDGKVKILFDDSGGPGKPPSKARKIFAEFGKNGKAEKIAVIGLNAIKRTIASFVMAYIGKETLSANIKQLRFFKSKEEALEWLKK